MCLAEVMDCGWRNGCWCTVCRAHVESANSCATRFPAFIVLLRSSPFRRAQGKFDLACCMYDAVAAAAEGQLAETHLNLLSAREAPVVVT